MSRGKNAGRIYTVKEGHAHAGKFVIALHRDQHEQIRKAKKICIYVTDTMAQGNLFGGPELRGGEKKVLISPEWLILSGFID